MLKLKQDYNTRDMVLNNLFRSLWEQHVMWTRMFIISKASDLGDLDLVTKRLLRNPDDFAKVLSNFYGNKKADEFKKLLEEHLLIAADLVDSAKKGDTAKAEEARKKWYKNADDIATYLSSINPYWNKNGWQKMLYEHLKMTEYEATERLNNRFANDIDAYDKIEEQALMMADYMARGIQKQFNA